jgi:hypothetical protein
MRSEFRDTVPESRAYYRTVSIKCCTILSEINVPKTTNLTQYYTTSKHRLSLINRNIRRDDEASVKHSETYPSVRP